MSFRYLAAAAFVFAFQATAAPKYPLSHISIQVVDQSKSWVPFASLEFIPSGGLGIRIRSNQAGQASIDLPQGTYDVRVMAGGFQNRVQKLIVDDRREQILEVRLEGDSRSAVDPCPIRHQFRSDNRQESASAPIPIGVKVTDVGGAIIPQARIRTSSSAGITTEIQADARGDAVLCLERGNYDISITFPGFASWSRKVNGERSDGQLIRAELKVGSGGGVEVTPIDLGIETESQILSESIPLEPLQSLMDLPVHKLRRLKWWRHAHG